MESIILFNNLKDMCKNLVLGFVAVLLTSFNLMAKTNKTETPVYNIQVKVKGLGAKDTCYLAYYYGDKQYVKDTAVADAKGQMTFTGKEKLDGGIYLVVLPSKKYFEVLVTEQQFALETDTSDFVKNMTVKNSNENKVFYDFLKFIAQKSTSVDSLRKIKTTNIIDSLAKQRKLQEIDKSVMGKRASIIEGSPTMFVAKLFKASQEIVVPDAPVLANGKKDSTFQYRYYKAHYFDNIDFSDDKMLRTPVFHQRVDNYIKKMVVQVPDSVNKDIDVIIKKARANHEVFKYCVWYLNYTYETSNIMGMDAIFVHMAEKYYLTKDVDWIDSTTRTKFKERYETLKPLLIGKAAPHTYLADTTNKLYDVYNVAAKYTIMFFYDPGCGHCQKDTPKLLEFYNKHKKDGVKIYAACIEREEAPWRKFIKDYKTQEFINVWDKFTYTDFRKSWDIYSTPVVYILDGNKKFIAKRIGVDQLEDFFEKGILKK